MKFSFCLDIDGITGSFHFSIVSMGTLEVYISSQGRGNFFSFGGMGQRSVSTLTYRMHVALQCGCTVLVAE